MTITYSGYGGSGGRPGNEWITIAGETSTTLTMRAFAFDAGAATVNLLGKKKPDNYQYLTGYACQPSACREA